MTPRRGSRDGCKRRSRQQRQFAPKPSATERYVRLARELPERPNENGGNIVFNSPDVNRHAGTTPHANDWADQTGANNFIFRLPRVRVKCFDPPPHKRLEDGCGVINSRQFKSIGGTTTATLRLIHRGGQRRASALVVWQRQSQKVVDISSVRDYCARTPRVLFLLASAFLSLVSRSLKTSPGYTRRSPTWQTATTRDGVAVFAIRFGS